MGWHCFLLTMVDRSGRPSQYRSMASWLASMMSFLSQYWSQGTKTTLTFMFRSFFMRSANSLFRNSVNRSVSSPG